MRCFFGIRLGFTHVRIFLSLFVLIRDRCALWRTKNTQKNVSWCKLNDSSTEHWAHANVAPKNSKLLWANVSFSHIRAEFFFSEINEYILSFYLLYVIFHVKSYTFQYLFMHESFVYFAFDYDPTLRFSKIDAHLCSFTHGSSSQKEGKK